MAQKQKKRQHGPETKHKYTTTTTTTREICRACSPAKVYLCLRIIEGMEKESREQLNGAAEWKFLCPVKKSF
jgi:hypothetical protein